MRVLYFISYPARMAGANRSLFELVTNLPSHVEPVVLLSSDGMVADAYRAAGIETRVMSIEGRLGRYGKQLLSKPSLLGGAAIARDLLAYQWRIAQTLREIRPDIVHTNDPRGTFIVAPVARLRGVPVVGHRRGEMTYLNTWQRWLYEQLCSRFVAVSAATRNDLSPAARLRCATVYNGTRDVSGRGGILPWVNHLRQSNVVVVSCLASVVPFKGYHHLLHAIAELNRRGWQDRAAFLFAGDLDAGHPEYAAWVTRLQRELGVTNATFVGWTSDPFAIYRSSDLTVLPSVSREILEMPKRRVVVEGNEGFPRTHLEAMCFGLPIVGTDIAGVREQIEDGLNGFVVPPSNPNILANAIERLLSDATLRKRMGAAGRARVLERFSTNGYVEGVLGVYQNVLLGKRTV